VTGRRAAWAQPIRRSLGEGGAALIMALLVIVCLAGLGLGLVATSSAERQISGNVSSAAAIGLAADAVVEGVITEVGAAPDWTLLLSGATVSAFSEGAHQVTTPSAAPLDLDAMTAELQADAAGTFPLGANTPAWRLFGWGTLATLAGIAPSASSAYVAVWVADDPADGDGSASTDANGVIMLHGEAFGRGGSRASADVVLSRTAGGPRVLSWRSR